MCVSSWFCIMHFQFPLINFHATWYVWNTCILSEWVLSWSSGSGLFLQSYLWSSVVSRRLINFPRATWSEIIWEMGPDTRSGDRRNLLLSLPTRAWTCPISKSLETDKSLLNEKTQVLEMSLATHPHFCLNLIFRGPTGEGSAPHRAMPCGKTMSPGASLSQGSIRPLLSSAEKSPAPKHLVTGESVPSGRFSPRWFSARRLVAGGLGPNDTCFLQLEVASAL